jgi:hypothetical protein
MNKKLADDLRVIAAGLRKQAEEAEKAAAVKCAQVLIAARGLQQLKRILNGGER